MKTTLDFEGGKDLEKAFQDLGAAASKRLATRALKKVAEPIRDKAKQLAPKDQRDLEESIDIGTRAVGSVSRPGPDEARVYVGIDESGNRRLHIYAEVQELGSSKQPAQPYFRPAWNSEGPKVPERLGPLVWDDLERTAKRQAKKAAKG